MVIFNMVSMKSFLAVMASAAAGAVHAAESVVAAGEGVKVEVPATTTLLKKGTKLDAYWCVNGWCQDQYPNVHGTFFLFFFCFFSRYFHMQCFFG